MSEVFDVDSFKSGYEPLRVRFRGEEYLFGRGLRSVLGVLAIRNDSSVLTGDVASNVAERLPDLVKRACPEFPDASDWTAAEEVALFQALTELLGRAPKLFANPGSGEPSASEPSTGEVNS